MLTANQKITTISRGKKSAKGFLTNHYMFKIKIPKSRPINHFNKVHWQIDLQVSLNCPISILMQSVNRDFLGKLPQIGTLRKLELIRNMETQKFGELIKRCQIETTHKLISSIFFLQKIWAMKFDRIWADMICCFWKKCKMEKDHIKMVWLWRKLLFSLLLGQQWQWLRWI